MENEVRLIDAKPLMQNGWHLVQTGESNKFLATMSLADVPTVDAVPVVHGHWVSLTDCANAGVYCSVCHKKVYKEDYAWCNRKNKLRSNYCPNCGAKMDGEGNAEKIIELFNESLFAESWESNDYPNVEAAVDHLIANGVTIPVRCKECKEWIRNTGIVDSPNGHCFYHDEETNGHDFCSYGERRTADV